MNINNINIFHDVTGGTENKGKESQNMDRNQNQSQNQGKNRNQNQGKNRNQGQSRNQSQSQNQSQSLPASRVMLQKQVELPDGAVFPVLTFASWEGLAGVRHCFSTRAGGVSEGYLASLNFRRDSYDTPENILENYRRVAAFFDTTPDRIVCAQQTHTSNVRFVTQEDAGKGTVRDRDYWDVDGLITDVPGLVLFTSHADCCSIYFYDPVRRVIALSHSGWKGTVARIGAVTVRKMQEACGCDPANIYAAIGPSICADCYEVSEDVAEAFLTCFGTEGLPSQFEGNSSREGSETSEEYEDSVTNPFSVTKEEPAASNDNGKAERVGKDLPAAAEGNDLIPRILTRGRRPGKFQLNLWEANARILREAGIRPDHLTVTDLCTCENAGTLFSHRATNGRRGNQGAFLMLEKDRPDRMQ